MSEALILAKLGACAGLGPSVACLQAEVAAGTSCFEQVPVAGRWVTAAGLERLGWKLDRGARCVALLERALDDLSVDVDAARVDELAVFVAVAEDLGPADRAQLAATIAARVGRASIVWVEHGRAGLILALAEARAHLDAPERAQERGQALALVVAVDSRCDPLSLAALADAEVLVDDSRDGLIPGEGACAALVCRPGAGPARWSTALRCVAPTIGREPQPFSGPPPHLAVGLSSLFATVAGALEGGRRAAWVVDAQPGPGRFVSEFHVAYLRNPAWMPEPLRRASTAPDFGDAGVASAGLALVRASQLLAEGEVALVYAGDDEGRLGAALIERTAGTSALVEALTRRWARPTATLASARAYAGRDALIDRHLEECGYLVLDRLDDLAGVWIAWDELGGSEARIQTHVDALSLAGAHAIARAREQLGGGSSDARVGASVILSSGLAQDEDRRWLLDRHTDGDEEALDELAAACELSPACPAALVDTMLGHGDPRLRARGLGLAAGRKDVDPDALIARLGDPSEEVRAAAARAIGRRQLDGARPQLLELARREPEQVAYLEALIWLGHDAARERLRWLLGRRAPTAAEAARVLALCGTDDDGRELARTAVTLPASVALIDALGCAGLVDAADWLLARLPETDDVDDALAEAAARALERILGVALRTNFADELGEGELIRTRRRAAWRELVEGRDWPRGVRLRAGAPFELAACWRELEGPSDAATRRLAADELALRGPARVHLSVTAALARQRETLARWSSQVQVTDPADRR